MKLPSRILYNGDCNYLFASDYRRNPGEPGPYTPQVLDDHVDLLADSGVDTCVMNPCGQIPWYPSKRLDHILTGYRRGDTSFVRDHYPPTSEDFTEEQLQRAMKTCTNMLDRYLDLQEQGVDWLAYVAGACRRRGVAPWLSVRMNDAHGANNWEGSFFNCPPQKDPRLRLEGRPMNPRQPGERYLTVCNYAKQEVRDYNFAVIEELVEEYDYEGLELDWLRMPLCCNPPASAEEIALMTEWHRQIRELTQRQAKKTGRPYPLGVRIPARLGALRTHGLDVVAWARQGLIDYVAPSNFWQTTWDLPYDRLRAQLGPDVTLYGVVEDAPNWMFACGENVPAGYRLLTLSAELMRGNAAGKLASGADGIEFFNFFCSAAVHKNASREGARYDAIDSIADLDALRGRPKQYAIQTTFNYWSPAFFEDAGQLPACVETGGWRRFELAMCREPEGMALTVQIVIERSDAVPDLGVSLNGCWPSFTAEPTDRLLFPTGKLTHLPPQYLGLNYRLPVEAIQDGINEIVVYDGDENRTPYPDRLVRQTRIISVEAAVK
ncbi:MAG: hypothetical protein ACYDCO_10920 [Armatimonadota bacterium]